MTNQQDTALLPVAEEALKPCPFCGGPGTLLRTAVDGSTHIVGCTDCSCCIGIQTASEAIAAWNKRAEQAKPSASCEAGEVERVARAIHEYLCRRDIMTYLDNDEDCEGIARAAIAALSERGAVGEEVIERSWASFRAQAVPAATWHDVDGWKAKTRAFLSSIRSGAGDELGASGGKG